jgi:hypothetical protein
MVDSQLFAQLGWVDVCNVIIELTKLLRHGKSDVTLRVGSDAVELSFTEAADLLVQATSSLRW